MQHKAEAAAASCFVDMSLERQLQCSACHVYAGMHCRLQYVGSMTLRQQSCSSAVVMYVKQRAPGAAVLCVCVP